MTEQLSDNPTAQQETDIYELGSRVAGAFTLQLVEREEILDDLVEKGYSFDDN